MTKKSTKAPKKASIVEETKEPSIANKKQEYIVAMSIKEDGKRLVIGDKYEGKNAEKLLKAKAIK